MISLCFFLVPLMESEIIAQRLKTLLGMIAIFVIVLNFRF